MTNTDSLTFWVGIVALDWELRLEEAPASRLCSRRVEFSSHSAGRWVLELSHATDSPRFHQYLKDCGFMVF